MILNDRARRFAHEYLVDLNGTQAAIRAGYTATSAAKRSTWLLDQPEVRSIIETHIKAMEARTNRSIDDVIVDIQRVAGKAEQRGQFMAALRGLELELKHHGALIENVRLGNPDGSPIQGAPALVVNIGKA